MGKEYLIDTNCLIEFIAKSLPESSHIFVENVINESFNISVINRIEILGHKFANQKLNDFLDLATVFPLNELVEKQTIELRKQKKIKLPDAIIASTAIVHNLILITRNTKDFSNIGGLECVNHYEV